MNEKRQASIKKRDSAPLIIQEVGKLFSTIRGFFTGKKKS